MPVAAGDAPSTPLVDVTFVVLDLETTGTSPTDCAITEVGALKFRGGELLGTFATLVDPGVPIPPTVVHFTGITEAMVGDAPRIESVLPALAEFVGEAVVVGHNVRFDLGFLRANLARLGYPPMANRSVDTWMLAKRLLRDDVPNHRLATVAGHLATEADPCHRALADAAATAEVFHDLLERIGPMGVDALDDLLAFPSTFGHPSAVPKLRWVGSLPRRPGVYLLRDVSGRVLFVERAADLRRRVRNHFAARDGRHMGPLLREAHALEHVVCLDDLTAAVLELRLIEQHRPPYNVRRRRHPTPHYVRIDARGRPALARPATRKRKGEALIGPLPLARARRAVTDPTALERARRRHHRLEALVAAGRLVVELDGRRAVVIDGGRLVSDVLPEPPADDAERRAGGNGFAPGHAEELALLSAWLDVHRHRLRLVHAEHGWAAAVHGPPPVPSTAGEPRRSVA